ncbi:3-deoxy-manno-octulosonate cytidylyltransferase [Escherichia coli]|nr:3-deoxy-manno-octulosonate cytidylyltransferase [Escherichia coli]
MAHRACRVSRYLILLAKPMIQHVYERALQVAGVAEVWVATDDPRVEQAVQAFDGKAIMTRTDHESGTDRLVEVMHKVDADIYINLQGDEPMIRPQDVETLLQGMRDDPALPVATLCHAISAEEATEPSTVKVVVNTRHDALYFSRSPIPYPRNAEKARYLKHVGIYAYRRDVLAKLQPATGVHAGAGGITGAATVNERGNQHSHV